MGGARWDPADWDRVSKHRSTMSRSTIFTATGMKDELDPSKIAVRECLDSDANPNACPIIIGSDVTGSMGRLSEQIIKVELGKIMKEIYDRKPVEDPQICVMSIGDSYCDNAPLQVTQFEADISLADQMEKFYLEGGGGGNAGESYMLPWYFAAYKTKCDSFTKRKKKGYIFTIGDEPMLPNLPAAHIQKIFGDGAQEDMKTKDLLTAVSENWHVFHLIVKPVGHYDVRGNWNDLLGQHAIYVSDESKLGEVIVSTIQIIEGENVDKVVKSWSGDTSLVVRDAVGGLTTAGSGTGVVRL